MRPSRLLHKFPLQAHPDSLYLDRRCRVCLLSRPICRPSLLLPRHSSSRQPGLNLTPRGVFTVADSSLETQVVSRAHRMGAQSAVHVELLIMQARAC